MSTTSALSDESLLRDVPAVDGWKVLPPAVLYAKIGQGGMGAVYRGRHVELEIDVAVKCLKPSLVAEDPQFEARFRREAKIAAELSHENLVRLYELRRAYGLSYLILEFVEGETARDRVARKGPLREEEAALIVLGAARGLAKAHRHPEVIVHRDIKPENILVSRTGEVKLADLGIAKALASTDQETLTTQGAIGTPSFMAPEQWEAPDQVGPATDVWALGATLYFLLVGKNAVAGASAHQIGYEVCHRPFPDVRLARPDLSAEIVRILGNCTQREAARRYPDAHALVLELEDLLGRRAPSLVDRDLGQVKAPRPELSPPPVHALRRIRALSTVPTGSAVEPTLLLGGGSGQTERLPSGGAVPGGKELRDLAVGSPPVAPARGAPLADGGGRRLRWSIAGGALLLVAVVTAGVVWWPRGAAPRTGSDGPAAELAASVQPPSPERKQPARAEPGPAAPSAPDSGARSLIDAGPVVGPASPTARAPRIVLDPALPAEGPIFVAKSRLELRGRIEDRVGDRLDLDVEGSRATYELAADGAFAIDSALPADATSRVVLSHGDAHVRLTVVQDSQDPEITLVAPAEPRRTREASVDVTVRVRETHLASVLAGSRRMDAGAAGAWIARGVGLPREGANEIAIVARDEAGRSSTVTFSVVRDSTPPKRTALEPAAGTALEPDRDMSLTLTFDEPLQRAELDGVALVVEGATARHALRVPRGAGAFEASLVVVDLVGNRATEILSWARTVVRARGGPEGWDVLDPMPGSGGWAKKVREPRSQIVFLLVEPGSFQMGSPASEPAHGRDEQQHAVEITQPFYLAETETTQAQYERVAGANPSRFQGLDLPVEQVSWKEAQAFCRAIGCDLPTEAQWEYACRAGTSGPFSCGPTIGTQQANYDGNLVYEGGAYGEPRKRTTAAQSFPPNGWGFADMHGNVWEWCRDAYRADYESLARQDPLGSDGAQRVMRGGSWYHHPRTCRSASREKDAPDHRSGTIGFRAAKSLP